MNYNFVPEFTGDNIYDCPFFDYCPNKFCLDEKGIEEKCLIF